MALAGTASMTINEMREFANFSAAEQRYIKRSLDIGLGRCDAFKLWARNAGENAAIRSQYVAYQELKALRETIPHDATIAQIEGFIGKLVRVAAFDLSQDRISCFSAFRFLYERLLRFTEDHFAHDWNRTKILAEKTAFLYFLLQNYAF